jgi:hypothetical protein
VWGGLGSQLFALLALEEAQSRYWFRRFRIVFHSSGVTERRPDLIGLLPQGLDIAILNDFSVSSEFDSERPIASICGSSIRSHVVRLLQRMRLVASWDDASSQPAFWTLQIRGHYRMLRVTPDSMNRVFKRILDDKLEIRSPHFDSMNAMHFRIGDLVGLKGIIDPKSLIGVAKSIQNRNKLKFQILSDSAEIASDYMSDIDLYYSDGNLGTWETVEVGYKSEVFVGTLSKISYWIVILRALGRPGMLSYLPRTSAEEITDYLAHYKIMARIIPYDYALFETPPELVE